MRRAPLFLGLFASLVVTAGAASAAPSGVSVCLDASEQGQELRDKGKLTKAAELFEKCAATSCPTPVRTSCAKWQAEVAESMPSIIIAARNESDEDVEGAVLTIDGATAEKVTGRAIALDPGPHTLVVSAPRHAQVEQKLVVTLAEKNRLVRFKLPKTDASSPVPTTTPPIATHETPPPAKPSGSVPVLPIVLGGVALAAGAASVVVGLGARGDLDELHKDPCASTKSCSADETSDIKTRLVVADVALGVAVVAAAAAVYLWVTAPSAPAKAAAWRSLGTGFSF